MKSLPNDKIFCNTPWYEAHIYWDGSLGICCQESRKLYDNNEYNIKNITLKEWFNSAPVRELRVNILKDRFLDVCSRCYHEEQMGGSSRRIRANQKSVIFTKTAFLDSYTQSPGHKHFEHSLHNEGWTTTHPIDLHIDLGNYCNLACKMCGPTASSTIATQRVKWGYEEDRHYLGNDWTKDTKIWQRFLNELLEIPKLKNIHFMGGETLLTNRMEELVDFMIAHDRYDLSFSFVTNGTVFNERLINKLKLFARTGIEVSIETATNHNDYIRQGTNTSEVLQNIQKYKHLCDNSSVSVTVRPAISLLSIGHYHTLLTYCLEHQLLVKSLMVTYPLHLDVKLLPYEIKQQYKVHYQKLFDKMCNIKTENDFNESDPTCYDKIIKLQALQCLNLLDQPTPPDSQKYLKNLINECKKWDSVYKLNARTLYPELSSIFDQYEY